MAPGKRWLWPCADSKVLRLPAYQKPPLHACLVRPGPDDHVLVDDSDDDLDDAHHAAKRRRIESIAHSFLAGQPIYISSARLRGPFPAHRDPAASQDYFLSSAAQSAVRDPTAADSFIRRRQHRPGSPEPLDDLTTTLTPSKLPSPPIGSARPARSQRSSRTASRITRRKTTRLERTTSHLSSLSSPSRLPPGIGLTPLHPDLDDAASGSHAPPSAVLLTASPHLELCGPEDKGSPGRAANILKQRPASFLNQAEKASTASPKPSTNSVRIDAAKRRLVKKTYQAAAATDATSPFMYRKNPSLAKSSKKTVRGTHLLQPRQTTDTSVQPPSSKPEVVSYKPSIDVPEATNRSQTDVSNAHPSNSVGEGYVNVATSRPGCFPSTRTFTNPTPSPQSPLSTTSSTASSDQPEFAPAIDISFGHDSFGVNFDIVDRYTDARISSSAAEGRPLSEQPRRALGESGAPNSRGPDSIEDTSYLHRLVAVPEGTVSGEPVSNGRVNAMRADDLVDIEITNAENVTTHGPIDFEVHEPTDDPTDEPINGTILDDPVDETTDDRTEVDDDGLGDEPTDDFPYISTQAAMQDAHRALFDASSPEKPNVDDVRLPLETPARVQPTLPSSPVHTITPFHQFNADLATNTQVPLPSTQALFDAYSPLKLSVKKPKLAKRASFAPSFIEEDMNSGIDINDDTEEPTSTAAGAEGQRSSDRTMHVLQTSTILSPGDSVRSGSNAPDIIPSQRSPSRIKEPRGPAMSQQSIRLSDIFASVSSQRGVDVNSLFSQDSSRSGSGKKTRKKGRASVRPSQSKKPTGERREGQRKSARLSMSQPQPEPDFEAGEEAKAIHTLSQPNLSTVANNRSFWQSEVSGASTIPDPSLASNHLRQNGTPASQESLLTPGTRPSGTALSSLQPAQRGFDDLDSTIEDLQRSVIQQWDVESAMQNRIGNSFG